jgi:ELWxxDGT repeat protein
MQRSIFCMFGLDRGVELRAVRRRSRGVSAVAVEALEIRQLLAADVHLIRDISLGASSSEPSQLTRVGENLFFTAESIPGDTELWTSDGTATGTRLVKDIAPGPASSLPRQLTDVNGILYFSARRVHAGKFELWRSDGTDVGTYIVADISPTSSAQLSDFTNVNGTLYFSATDGTTGQELWKSDGTAAGTVLVKDMNPGSGSGSPRGLLNVGGILFFSADDGMHGRELWKSDGTSFGTVMVQDSVPGPVSASPVELTEVGGMIFYTTYHSANQGLWKSDGTNAGTVPVRAFSTVQGGLNYGLPTQLTAVGDKLFFTATETATGLELWSSDGTSSGTQLVKDIFPGTFSSVPSNLINYNGTLFFSVGYTGNGPKFYKSDGTEPGTIPANSLAVSGLETPLTVHSGKIYFIESANGKFSVWSSNGISEPVFEYQFDFVGRIGEFESVGDTLYFMASDVSFGGELWALNQLTPPSVTDPATFATSIHPTIAWTAVPDAVSYDIRIHDRTNGIEDVVEETVSATSITPTADFGLGRYEVLLRSNFSGGRHSGWSRSYVFRNYLPVIPQSLDRFQTTSRPTISWNALPGAAKYELWIDNLTTGQNQVIRDSNITTTTFTPSVDLPMGVYRARVRGVTSDGLTGFNSTRIDFVVLTAPTVIGPVNSTFNRQPTFSWNAIAGAVRYEIVVRNSSTRQNVFNVTNIIATNWTPPIDLAAGSYQWWVVAVSPEGYRSQAPQVAEFFVGGRTAVLSPIGSVNDRTPTFIWRPVDGAAAFNVQVNRIDVPIVRFIYVTSIVATTEYTPVMQLPPGRYRVWVQAIGKFGEPGFWSRPVDFEVTQLVPSNSGLVVGLDVAAELNSPAIGIREQSAVPKSAEVPPRATLSDSQVETADVTNAEFDQTQYVITRRNAALHAVSSAELAQSRLIDRLMAAHSESDQVDGMF